MDFDREKLIGQFLSLETRPRDLDPEVEADHLIALCAEPTVAPRLESYDNPEIRGVGGSGIIIKAKHKSTESDRALKFPRSRIYHTPHKEGAGEQAAVDVDPELRALERLSHQNITRLYEAFPLPIRPFYCMVTEYVHSSLPLDRYAKQLCCSPEVRARTVAISHALKSLSKLIYQVVDALHYIHETGDLLHFDVKPENILVTPEGVAYVTDFGFAREPKQYGQDEVVEVGFTWKYAHPRLLDPHQGARVSSTPEKAKSPLPGRELRPHFDIFAFGRTIQEVLGHLESEYNEHIYSYYDFGYLHAVACLCLDGKNGSSGHDARPGQFVSDFAFGMPARLFALGSFHSFRDVRMAMQRLVGLRRLEDDLPETDGWLSSTIKVGNHGTAALTPRVADIINHPLLTRLKRERQLGMLDLVFPTATHTRYQHTLGTYQAACQYIAALYNDPENPIFKILFDPWRCGVLLLATLVHDLGHTAYGHELEEIDKREFKHELFLTDILHSDEWKDDAGRTIRDVIKAKGDWAWHADIEDILGLLEAGRKPLTPIDGVLRDIIDSQIDADKFDYLLRDSVETGVTYGMGIDYDRFLHSLTTYPSESGVLRLAVKQKGAASAESFALARYELYQSVYWHHAFRATKAMLLESVRLTLRDLYDGRGSDIFDNYPLRTAYIRNVIGVKDYMPGGTEGRKGVGRGRPTAAADDKSISAAIEQRLADRRTQVGLVPYDTDETIKFLWRLAPERARVLLQGLVERRLYKRVIEVSPQQLSMPSWQTLRDDFMDITERGRMQESVHDSLYNALWSAAQSRALGLASMAEDGTLRRIMELRERRVLFLLDIPLRGWFPSAEYPVYVSDYKRRHFRAEAAQQNFERNEGFWIGTMGELMKRIAFIRLYCEPELHSIVTRVMNPAEILLALKEAIPALGPLRG